MKDYNKILKATLVVAAVLAGVAGVVCLFMEEWLAGVVTLLGAVACCFELDRLDGWVRMFGGYSDAVEDLEKSLGMCDRLMGVSDNAIKIADEALGKNKEYLEDMKNLDRLVAFLCKHVDDSVAEEADRMLMGSGLRLQKKEDGWALMCIDRP